MCSLPNFCSLNGSWDPTFSQGLTHSTSARSAALPKLSLLTPYTEHPICSKSWVSQPRVTSHGLLLSRRFQHLCSSALSPTLLSSGAPNPLPFLVRVISSFLKEEGKKHSGSTPNLQARPMSVNTPPSPLLFGWSAIITPPTVYSHPWGTYFNPIQVSCSPMANCQDTQTWPRLGTPSRMIMAGTGEWDSGNSFILMAMEPSRFLVA